MADVQKFIALRPFIRSGSLNNRWKAEKLLYVWPVYAPTVYQILVNVEHSQRMGWGRELPRKQESTSTAEFGSSDHPDP
jgi:hypothetical protein